MDIEILQSMLLHNQFNKEQMLEILSHYQDHPAVLPCKVLAGSKIIRSSFNADSEFHNNVARLSYPPAQYARTDRTSLKGKPMFYASVFTSAYKEGAYPRIISALETTDILRGYEKTGKAFTTQSAWSSDRDLRLFAFPFSKKYKKPCEEIVYQRKFWDEGYSKYWSQHYIVFSEFISDLLATPAYSCLYDITATTIDFLMHKSTLAQDVDGIMYPSVWGDGAGMNICLKPEVVDEHVHFQAASLQIIDKEKGEATIRGVADSVLYPNDELKWKITEFVFDSLVREYGIEKMFKDKMIYIDDAPI